MELEAGDYWDSLLISGEKCKEIISIRVYGLSSEKIESTVSDKVSYQKPVFNTKCPSLATCISAYGSPNWLNYK